MRPGTTAADDSPYANITLRFLRLMVFRSWPLLHRAPRITTKFRFMPTTPSSPRSTMVVIDSNCTAQGSSTVQHGVLPSNHAEHETLEITQGINDWAKLGFYLFSSIQPHGGW